MKKQIFPGLQCMTFEEVRIFSRLLKDSGENNEVILDTLAVVDDCLSIQKAASIINRFAGTRSWNKKRARDLMIDRASQNKLSK